MDSAGKRGLHGGSFINPWIVQESLVFMVVLLLNPWIVQESVVFMVVLLLTPMGSAGKLGLHGGSFVNPWVVQESLVFMVVLLLTHG